MLVAILAMISAFIAANLLLGNGPIWPAITLYWVVVAIKNITDLKKWR